MKKTLFLIVFTIVITPSVTAQSEIIKNEIGFEQGVVRRDPSDVIKVGDKYYVYYTKMVYKDEVERAKRLNLKFSYPEGYHGDIYVAESKDEGYTWKECGVAVKRGEQGRFDSNSCFTPNILRYKNKFYLYYTAVGDNLGNPPKYSDHNRTVIGLAVSKSPKGPFKKLKKPIFESTRDNNSFDSYRVDDSALRIVKGKIWLYYKGVSWANATPNTMIGLAVASKPKGPYKRLNNGEPIQRSGHEVLVWEYEDNVYSFAHHGHGENSGTFRVSKDGKYFEGKGAIVSKSPKLHAPGLYRPEICGQKAINTTVRWGMEMDRSNPEGLFLKRFELDMKVVNKEEDVYPSNK